MNVLVALLAGTGLAFLTGAALAHELAGETALEELPRLADVAPDAVNISPHVPNMGEHWAEHQNLPGGPIYCVIDGRVVCLEYMFDASDLDQGTDWTELAPGIETPPISHVDVEYKAEGIEPHPVPLYQMHIYFTGTDTLAAH